MTKTLAAAGFAALIALAGCNTVAGVAEDVQAGGAAVQETAETIKNENY